MAVNVIRTQHGKDGDQFKKTHIAICFGALGILGALSIFDGPARNVSLK
jgi:hypothetical protein